MKMCNITKGSYYTDIALHLNVQPKPFRQKLHVIRSRIHKHSEYSGSLKTIWNYIDSLKIFWMIPSYDK